MKGKIVTVHGYVKNGIALEYMVMDTLHDGRYLLSREGDGSCLVVKPDQLFSINEPMYNEPDLVEKILYYLELGQAFLPQIIDQIKKAKRHGAAYDIDYLHDMRYKIAFLPVEEQAIFADIVTRSMVDTDHDFEDLIELDNNHDLNNFSQSNATSIGNVAYIALNHKVEKYRIAAHNFLLRFKTYVQDNDLFFENPTYTKKP